MRAFTFAALTFVLAAAASAAPTRVAVLDLRTPDGAGELGQTLTDLVAFELEESGAFQVMTRDALASAVKLKGMQQALGCDTEACQAALGKAVEVEQLVTGSVGRVGSRYVLVLRLIDVTSTSTLKQAKKLAPASEDALVDAISLATRDLLAKGAIVRRDTPAPDWDEPRAVDADDAPPLANGGLTPAPADGTSLLGAVPPGVTFGSVTPPPAKLKGTGARQQALSPEAESELAKRIAKRIAERRRKRLSR